MRHKILSPGCICRNAVPVLERDYGQLWLFLWEARDFRHVRFYTDVSDNQLEVIVKDENGEYKKHFIGLSNNVTYVVEDITTGDVSKYKYTLNFNPEMWLPKIKTID